MRRLLRCIFALVLCFSFANCNKKTVSVETTSGTVEGKIAESLSGFKVDTFLGVKYGEVPERFSKPLAAKKWEGVKKAVSWPPRCRQIDAFGNVPGSMATDTEDCLYLNIFAPHEKVKNGYPVMVFIHGGGFQLGSTLEYGSEGITNWVVPKGVVFVDFHYRLSMWGFFSTGTPEAQGNWGLWDQQLLLEWVQRNVGRFGGDPSKVTLFGESAGATSTSLHSISPRSYDLFSNSILMSCSAFTPGLVNENVVDESYKLAKHLGCPTESVKEMLTCMRAISNSEIEDAIYKTTQPDVILGGFMPRVDGQFLPKSPEQLLEVSPNKPTIIGMTADEMALFVNFKDLPTAWSINDPKEFTVEKLHKLMRRVLETLDDKNADILTELALFQYVDNLGCRKNHSLLVDAFMKFFSDFTFVAPGHKEAQLRLGKGEDVWMYSFDYYNSDIVKYSTHFLDLWYFFKMMMFRPPTFTEEENLVANHYTTLFTNFAKFGQPTKDPVEGVTWPQITKVSPEINLKISERLAVSDWWHHSTGAFWNKFLPKIHELLPHSKSPKQKTKNSRDEF